jgi:SAM-dependent methyltransferase
MATNDTPTIVPNHHARYPGFAGLGGLVAALSMLVGRGGDADLAVELTGLHRGDRLVDVGCGPGVAARRAAGAGATVTGVEPASVMRTVARRMNGHRGIDYVEGLAEDLPVSDASATVVWSIAAVHHWPELETGLAEAHRVLEHGGRFLAIERRTRPGATGHASHGWTDPQAEAFAEACRVAGFDRIGVERRTVGRRDLVAVVGVKP